MPERRSAATEAVIRGAERLHQLEQDAAKSKVVPFMHEALSLRDTRNRHQQMTRQEREQWVKDTIAAKGYEGLANDLKRLAGDA